MSLNRRNIIALVLLCSVALNLFFVGTLVARYMDRPERPSEPPSMRWLMRDLDPATRERLRPQTSTFGQHLRPLRADMFRAQREVNELLAADTVDQQAIAQAFEKLRAASLRYQELSHQQLAQVVTQLTVEQRTQALRFMLERRNPDGERGAERNRDRDANNETGNAVN